MSACTDTSDTELTPEQVALRPPVGVQAGLLMFIINWFRPPVELPPIGNTPWPEPPASRFTTRMSPVRPKSLTAAKVQA